LARLSHLSVWFIKPGIYPSCLSWRTRPGIEPGEPQQPAQAAGQGTGCMSGCTLRLR